MTLERVSFGEFSVLHRPGREGSEPAVHFAHATGFNAATYAPIFRTLDPALDLYAMDARGHGSSRAEAVPAKLRSWGPLVDDLDVFVNRLGRPVVLAGHSMGGTVSMAVAARRPHLVKGLVLVDPVMLPPRLAWSTALLRALGLTSRIPIARAAAKRRTTFASREEAVENFAGKGPFRTWKSEFVEAYVEGGTFATGDMVRLRCAREWEARVFAKAMTRPFRHLRRVSCPVTLLVRARPDLPMPESSVDAFARTCPRARVLRLEGATHFIPMESPDIVRDEIERAVEMSRSEL